MNLDRHSYFHNKRIVITGGAGTVGARITDQLHEIPGIHIRVVDNDEHRLFEMEQSYKGNGNIEFYFGDIRDESELTRLFSGVDFVFHTAALKHVPFCEGSPFSAVQTNIFGTNAVIRAALDNEVEKVLFTSSDKAVNPTNVMGTSKLMGERLFTASNYMSKGKNKVIFASTRFGNVAGSSGSVLPVFCNQIERGVPVTLTDRRMTRFMMTVDEAVSMVIDSLMVAKGGEVFVTKMPVVRISDVADALVSLLGPVFHRSAEAVEIVEIGPRAGEKLWEELSTEEESRRIFASERFLAVLPATSPTAHLPSVEYAGETWEKTSLIYNSHNETPLSMKDVIAFLLKPGVLAKRYREPIGAPPAKLAPSGKVHRKAVGEK